MNTALSRSIIACSALALASACSSGGTRYGSPEQVIGNPLPEVEGAEIGTVQRDRATDDDSPACTVRILWATWCPSCKTEMLQMGPWVAALASPPNVELVHIDPNIRSAEILLFLGTNQIAFPAIGGVSGTRSAHGVSTIPTLFIADEEGIVQHTHTGLHTEESFGAALEASGCDASRADG